MTQTTQSNNIMNEENKLVRLKQGPLGTLMQGRIYKNFDFDYKLRTPYPDERIIDTYYNVAVEFIKKIAPDNVIMFHVLFEKKIREQRKKRRFYTEPVFAEDGKIGILKNKLKSGEYNSAIWADYMFYYSDKYDALGFIPSEAREYFRELIVLQEHTDLSLADVMAECGKDAWETEINVYPHNKIEYCEDKNMTVHKYMHSDDFIFCILPSLKTGIITIEPNPKYMSYEDMISAIEPLFAKYGLYIEDKTDPYIYCGFPPDYQEYNKNKYNLGGYKFIE